MSDSEVQDTPAPVVVDEEQETKRQDNDDAVEQEEQQQEAVKEPQAAVVAAAASTSTTATSAGKKGEEEAQPFVESEVATATGTEQSSTTSAKQRATAPFQDDAWIMNDAPGAERSSTKSPAKELLRPATEPKPSSSSTTPASGQQPPKGITALVGRVLGKLHIAVDAIETSRNFVLTHWLYCQAYVAVVLLLFGSYFLQTIKCYEALLRLGFLEKFSAHYGRVKAVLETNKGQSGARKVSALRQQLRPHLGDIARTIFLCAT